MSFAAAWASGIRVRKFIPQVLFHSAHYQYQGHLKGNLSAAQAQINTRILEVRPLQLTTTSPYTHSKFGKALVNRRRSSRHSYRCHTNIFATQSPRYLPRHEHCPSTARSPDYGDQRPIG